MPKDPEFDAKVRAAIKTVVQDGYMVVDGETDRFIVKRFDGRYVFDSFYDDEYCYSENIELIISAFHYPEMTDEEMIELEKKAMGRCPRMKYPIFENDKPRELVGFFGEGEFTEENGWNLKYK